MWQMYGREQYMTDNVDYTELEVCENDFTVPITSHPHDFFPIPIPKDKIF